ncbi:IclR family transcriptional regulator [Cytobacillus gottheilii]|uniref:IclR family transcriptional regulator n=1 Tax=Cytobacillus gottheilii TaxID=859144 RepID=UPI0009B9ECBA|nr:IclR family transcriptional regulator [Cytobacillus gottheilii]
MKTEKQTYGTVLLKADLILNYLAQSDQPQRLNEIALHTEVSKPTVLKILDTLLLIGYVQKDIESKKFSLGPALIKFGKQSTNGMEIKQIAQPYLEVLSEKTTETIHLGILNKDSIVYIDKIESKNPISLYSQVGKSLPLYCSAMGKAMLAEQSDEELTDYLKKHELIAMTNKTITSTDSFLKELQQIRQNGYAFDDGEHEAEVFCVGASLSLGQKNYGAFSVSVPKYRLTEESLQNIIVAVKSCKKDIIHELKMVRNL